MKRSASSRRMNVSTARPSGKLGERRRTDGTPPSYADRSRQRLVFARIVSGALTVKPHSYSGFCQLEAATAMAEHAQTWHYGLVAKWWAEFNDDGPEIAYFHRFVESGQPALDAACGTGRLLIPYLKAGLDVDGCDVSSDMIALCREKAESAGVSPTLFVQPLHKLDPPRSYRTIFCCGGFGLGSDREQDAQALRRFHECLQPGGTLILDNENPYIREYPWRYWVRSERVGIPRAWPPLEEAERRRGTDGAEYAQQSRVVDIDPLEQRAT